MIPSEFTIDGVPWAVAVCDHLEDDVMGMTLRRQCRVLLAKDVCPSVQGMTFWHELLHAIFTTRDFMLVPNGDSPVELEEQIASFLGPALYSFFAQNAEIAWRYDSIE